MPREIITRTTVYRFDELSEDAKAKALEKVREKLSGDWWDQSDNDDIAATMLHTLAAELRSPGWDTHGDDDFPGITGVTIEGWDVEARQSIAVNGQLTRDNAPALPWIDGIDAVELEAKRSDHTLYSLLETEPECTCPDTSWLAPHEPGCPFNAPNPATEAERIALEQAAREAVQAAWQAGYFEMEHKTSEEYAKGWIEANGAEFLEDGTLH